LRNRIYTFAAFKPRPKSRKCSALPCLALALACRQLHAEYLPICKKVRVRIAWKDVPGYLDTFFPTIAGQVQGIELAPPSVTIVVDQCRKNGKYMSIDLLPFIKMCHANADFRIDLVLTSKTRPADWADDLDIFAGETTMFENFIRNDHPDWIANVRSGEVVKMMVDPLFICTGDEPEIRFFFLYEGKNLQLEDELDREQPDGEELPFLSWLDWKDMVYYDTLNDDTTVKLYWVR
jgi:hypothetical protein